MITHGAVFTMMLRYMSVFQNLSHISWKKENELLAKLENSSNKMFVTVQLRKWIPE